MSRISLGVVLVLSFAWFYLKAEQLFPSNTALWKERILIYIVFTAFIFSWDVVKGSKTERSLFEVSFVKAFPVFLIASVVSFVILSAITVLVKGEALQVIATSLSSVSIGVLIYFAFVVSTLEEKVFRGWLVERLRARKVSKTVIWWIQALVFAVFHALLGKSFVVMLIYVPLGFLFMWVKMKWSPRTDMANSGCHFAYDLWIISVIQRLSL